jgi:ribosomal protein S18 acetylase RimI-like enzyme
LEAALAFLKSRGAPRVVLYTAERNEVAQRLFASVGFRRLEELPKVWGPENPCLLLVRPL